MPRWSQPNQNLRERRVDVPGLVIQLQQFGDDIFDRPLCDIVRLGNPATGAEVVVRFRRLLARNDRDLAFHSLTLQIGSGERADIVF
jgi:hypothetical protein